MEPYSCQNSPLHKKFPAAHQLWLKIGSREKQSLEEMEMVDGHLLPLRLHIPPSNPLHSPPSLCTQSSQLTITRLLHPLLHSWQKAHPCCSLQRWGLKGRKCCSCSSFSSRTVMSPAAAKLHNTIYDPSILDIQISSLESGNLTVKLQHLFYQQSRRNEWTQDSTILHHFNKFSSTHEN
jgi:hypothetical protein